MDDNFPFVFESNFNSHYIIQLHFSKGA